MLRYSIIAVFTAGLCCGAILHAQQETIYMSVLNSRKHRLGALDNPTVGLFLSTDQGATWHHRGWEYTRAFYAEAGPDGAIWSACGNGVLRSTDGGTTWRIATGWQITEVLKVKVHPKDAHTAYASTAYGIFKTTDGGETWREKNSGFQKPFAADVVIDRTKPSRLLAATEEGVYRSANGGDRWVRVGAKVKGVRTIAQDPHDGKTFWLGTEEDGLFVSRNEGAAWASVQNFPKSLTVYAIVFDPSVGSVLYVGTHGGGVYRSLDGGATWKQCSAGLKNLDVHSLVVVPSNSRIVLAGTLNGGLYRSTDGGNHWEFNSQEEGQVWGLSVR